MANRRSLTIEVELDERGTVRGVRQIGSEFTKLGNTVEGVTGDLREQFAGLEARQELVSDATQDFQVVASRSFRSVRDSVINYRNAAENAAQAQERMGVSTGRTTNLLFDMQALVEDIPFGMRAVGNNISFVIEGFTRWRSNLGETQSAWGQLLAAMKGPAGALIFVSIATTLFTMAQNMGLFADETDDAEERMKDLREAWNQVVNISEEGVLGEVEFGGTQEAQSALSRIRQTREEMLRFQELMERQGEGALVSEAIRQSGQEFPILQQRMQETERQIITLADAQELFRFDAEQLRAAEKELQDALENRKEEQEAVSVALEFGADVQRDKTQATDEEASATERLNSLIDRQIQKLRQQRKQRQALLEASDPGQRPEREGTIFPDPFSDEQLFRVQDFANLLGGPALDSVEEIERAINELNKRLGQTGSTEQRRQIIRTITLFTVYKRELESGTKAALAMERAQKAAAKAVKEFNEAAGDAGEETEDQADSARTAMDQMAAGIQNAASALRLLRQEADSTQATISQTLQAIGLLVQTLPGEQAQGAGRAIGATGALVGAFQHGTDNFPGGVGMFGERGPELAMLPRGSTVFDHLETKRLLSGSTMGRMGAGGEAAGTGNLQAEIQRLGDRIENLTVITKVSDVDRGLSSLNGRRNKVNTVISPT